MKYYLVGIIFLTAFLHQESSDTKELIYFMDEARKYDILTCKIKGKHR